MARILVIDDSSTSRAWLRQTLEHAQHEVVEADDGRIGLDLHSEQPADLIITDLMMPNQDGLETLMLLRKRDENVKVIALTSGYRGETRSYLRMASLLGAAKCFTKKVSGEELCEAVDSLLHA